MTCTYTNTKNATITVIKDAVPDAAQDFAFTTTGSGGGTFGSGFSLDDDADGTLPASRTFTFTAPTRPAPRRSPRAAVAGWTLTNLVCTGGGANDEPRQRRRQHRPAPGEAVTCTYTNTQNATITVTKDAVPDAAQDFGFATTGSGGGTPSRAAPSCLDDDADGTLPASRTFTFTGADATGTKTIQETPAGHRLDADEPRLHDGASRHLATGLASIALLPGEAVTCTYTNTQNATITVTKDAVPDAAQDFAYTTTGTGGGTFGSGFSLDDDADGTLPASRTFTFTGADATGTKTITESRGGRLDADEPRLHRRRRQHDDLATGVASIGLDPGEAVTCTYTNTQNATITVTKDAVPDAAQDFAFTTTGTGGGSLRQAAFSLDDDADATLPASRTFTFTGADATGTKTIPETLPVTGWTLDEPRLLEGHDTTLATGLASIALVPGEAVTCTYTNTQNATITVTKDAVPDAAQDFALHDDRHRRRDLRQRLQPRRRRRRHAPRPADFTFTGADATGTKTIKETLPVPGWTLTNLVCSKGREHDHRRPSPASPCCPVTR